MNTLRTGSYGIDQSRVYTLNGATYYDKAVICHPAVLAQQTKRFRAGPPQPYFPFATTREEGQHPPGQTRPLNQDSLQRRQLFHGLRV
jgi:hypothetical protein